MIRAQDQDKQRVALQLVVETLAFSSRVMIALQSVHAVRFNRWGLPGETLARCASMSFVRRSTTSGYSRATLNLSEGSVAS